LEGDVVCASAVAMPSTPTAITAIEQLNRVLTTFGNIMAPLPDVLVDGERILRRTASGRSQASRKLAWAFVLQD
jgi:hypothetical protein